jgi:DNA topoisomerase-1
MPSQPATTLPTDVSAADDAPAVARKVGLRYVDDSRPGIGRKKSATGFRYVAPDGKPVRDEDEISRIRALAIPPAWTDVWICPYANGHIQATGRDAKKRKQYRYHAQWRSVRDESKYERMLSFGSALPRIRAQVDEALALPGLPREKVLATVVALLQKTMIRIGNAEYARTNKSFGLTTLRNRHVEVSGREIAFQFRGKSGVMHTVRLHDPRLARIVKRIRDLPGQELFQYIDDDGERRSIDSADVNDYLRTLTGEDYTAKDFRTWSGTLLAALELQALCPCESEAGARRNIVQAIANVAQRLGNTPAVCRKCYVHPAVLDCYLQGAMRQTWDRLMQSVRAADDPHALKAEEMAVLALLQARPSQPRAGDE